MSFWSTLLKDGMIVFYMLEMKRIKQSWHVNSLKVINLETEEGQLTYFIFFQYLTLPHGFQHGK